MAIFGRSYPSDTKILAEIARVHTELSLVGRKLDLVLQNQEKMMAIQDDIRAAFTKETEDEGKLIAVLQATLASNKDLADKLAAALANAADPAQMQQLLDQINANNAAMEAELTAANPPTP